MTVMPDKKQILTVKLEDLPSFKHLTDLLLEAGRLVVNFRYAEQSGDLTLFLAAKKQISLVYDDAKEVLNMLMLQIGDYFEKEKENV